MIITTLQTETRGLLRDHGAEQQGGDHQIPSQNAAELTSEKILYIHSHPILYFSNWSNI